MNTLKKIGFMCLVTAVLLLTLSSCSDDDQVTVPVEKSGSVTILVDETTICHLCSAGYAFTSAADGTVLDFKTMVGPGELELDTPNEAGTVFYATRVEVRPGNIRFYTTPHEVTDDLSLDWSVDRISNSFREANMEFLNIPVHEDCSISDGGMTEVTAHLREDTRVGLTMEPTDVLILLELVDGSFLFKWVEDVTYDASYQVDMSECLAMEKASLSIQPVDFGAQYFITGIQNPTLESPRRSFGMDLGWIISGSPAHQIGINVVPDGLDLYETHFIQEGPGPDHSHREFHSAGGLPDEVTFWDLEITLIATGVDGTLVGLSQVADELTFLWAQDPEGSEPREGVWEMVVPDRLEPGVMPRIPEALTAMYPGLDRDGFRFVYAAASRSTETVASDGQTPVTFTEKVTQFASAEMAEWYWYYLMILSDRPSG